VIEWAAIALTAQLAAVTVALLLVIGTPLAWWLANSYARARYVVEAVVALPLVLPPTVLGFYLLLLLGPHGWVGHFWESAGGPRLVFSFPGLVIGSVLYSMPFVVQPLQNAFASIGAGHLDAAAVLRAGPIDRFFTIAAPLARRGFVTASVLGFAHTVGEFGVVLMVGGNIPGVTRTVSVSIYDSVQSLDYAGAGRTAALLLVVSFVVLSATYALQRDFRLSSGR
jgi:molybdate transport system permease protein